MNLQNLKRLAPAVLVVALVATSAFAKGGKHIGIKNALVNGIALSAGSYGVTWSADSGDPSVNFIKDNRTVASVRADWADRNTQYEQNEVVYSNNKDGSRTVIEIRFAGMNRALVFEADPSL